MSRFATALEAKVALMRADRDRARSLESLIAVVAREIVGCTHVWHQLHRVVLREGVTDRARLDVEAMIETAIVGPHGFEDELARCSVSRPLGGRVEPFPVFANSLAVGWFLEAYRLLLLELLISILVISSGLITTLQWQAMTCVIKKMQQPCCTKCY